MRARKALIGGIVAGSVALGAAAGAAAFVPGLGLAQTDDGTEDAGGGQAAFARWCFGYGEGPFALVADAIGIPHGDLMYAMRQGSTIAEVAGSEGIDVQVVIDALVASMQDELDVAVEEGFFSQDVADEIAAGFDERATDIVNGRVAPRIGGGPGFGFGHGPWGGQGPWGEASPEAQAALAGF